MNKYARQWNSLRLLKRKGQGGVMSRFMFAMLPMQHLFELQKNFMLHLKFDHCYNNGSTTYILFCLIPHSLASYTQYTAFSTVYVSICQTRIIRHNDFIYLFVTVSKYSEYDNILGIFRNHRFITENTLHK